MKFNYSRICNNLINGLSERTKLIIKKRFGLGGFEARTLESIGKEYGITRERVRQVEREGLVLIKSKTSEVLGDFSKDIIARLKRNGGLKKEEIIVSEWEDIKFRNYVLFLLSLIDGIERFKETADFYSFWAVSDGSIELAKQVIKSFLDELKENGHPLSIDKYSPPSKIGLLSSFPLNKRAILSYIEISKKVMKGADGLYGLPSWPEINPKGIRDKAYIIFKKIGEPLHFTKAAALINDFPLFPTKKILIQSVHNELIKDPRFVLVGRGLYALKEWGYVPGVTRDIILKILKDEKKPLSRDLIIKKVLEQREVKKSTILLNLSDKRYFARDSEGRYFLRPNGLEVDTA